MKIIISFPLDSFETASQALELIYPHLNIEINNFFSEKSFANGQSPLNVEEKIKKMQTNKDSSFSLDLKGCHVNDGENRINFRKDLMAFTDIFILELENEININLEGIVNDAVKFNFSTICKFDFQKARWQSEEYISNYDYYKKQHTHLKKIINPNLPPLIAEKIDISQNPGHQRLTYNMYLMASPEIWFGPNSLLYFDKRQLLSFSKAEKISEIGNEVVYIKLFDWTTPNYESEEILGLQSEFRAWTEMDKIERHLNNSMNFPNS